MIANQVSVDLRVKEWLSVCHSVLNIFFKVGCPEVRKMNSSMTFKMATGWDIIWNPLARIFELGYW